jgi:hypothetical protein
VLTEYRYLFGDPIGRLHFAPPRRDTHGREHEAALESGERAARDILAA